VRAPEAVRRRHPAARIPASPQLREQGFTSLSLKASPGAPSFRCTMIPIPDLFVDSEAETSAVKLPIRSLHQMDCHSCGPVAAWAVARAFGQPPIGYGKFHRLTRCAAGDGAEPPGVRRALRACGLPSSYREDLDFEALRDIIGSGWPVLTGVGHDMFDGDVGDHWVFVYGVGWKPKRVYLGNQGLPLFSTVMWSWKRFKREWNPPGLGRGGRGPAQADCALGNRRDVGPNTPPAWAIVRAPMPASRQVVPRPPTDPRGNLARAPGSWVRGCAI
jgi:hypothetical protein